MWAFISPLPCKTPTLVPRSRLLLARPVSCLASASRFPLLPRRPSPPIHPAFFLPRSDPVPLAPFPFFPSFHRLLFPRERLFLRCAASFQGGILALYPSSLLLCDAADNTESACIGWTEKGVVDRSVRKSKIESDTSCVYVCIPSYVCRCIRVYIYVYVCVYVYMYIHIDIPMKDTGAGAR